VLDQSAQEMQRRRRALRRRNPSGIWGEKREEEAARNGIEDEMRERPKRRENGRHVLSGPTCAVGPRCQTVGARGDSIAGRCRSDGQEAEAATSNVASEHFLASGIIK
jgi:hypothetical protein